MSGIAPSQAPASGAGTSGAPAPVAGGPTAAAAPPAASTTAASTGGAAGAGGVAPKGGKKKGAQGAGAQAGGAPKPKAVRKKKPSAKAGGPGGAGAASRQQLLQDSKQAQAKLQQHRSLLAGMKTDPLWLYRIEDVLPAISEPNAMVGKTTVLPEQVQVIENAIRQTGLHKSDLSPQAVACLLEQARRYALELLTDAQDYAHVASAGHPAQDISKADLLLAAEMRADHPVAISSQLPKLNVSATRVNRVPLPPLPTHCFSGIVLPPKEQQVTGRTFDVIQAGQVARRMVQDAPKMKRKSSVDATSAAAGAGGSGNASGSGASSYGASRGRQIPIKLKPAAAPAAASAAPPAPTAP
jgi:Transcription initiation factor IID, 31kD subunit